ncbi:MAG: hypothetical protein OXR73_23670, partial [Myxococcales bacterium]|nr:hypothetical protein [Myxococcales bacterium]
MRSGGNSFWPGLLDRGASGSRSALPGAVLGAASAGVAPVGVSPEAVPAGAGWTVVPPAVLRAGAVPDPAGGALNSSRLPPVRPAGGDLSCRPDRVAFVRDLGRRARPARPWGGATELGGRARSARIAT